MKYKNYQLPGAEQVVKDLADTYIKKFVSAIRHKKKAEAEKYLSIIQVLNLDYYRKLEKVIHGLK